MNYLKKVKGILDSIVDNLAAIFLACMTIIITLQVFTRSLFSYTPRWSEEVSILLLIWLTFFGIAVGFREKLHIGVEFFVKIFPERIQRFFELISKILILITGGLFIYYGTHFTKLMHNSTMAGTGLPQSVLYSCIPVCGFLLLIYGIELLFKKGLHQEWDEELDIEDFDALKNNEKAKGD